MKQWAAVSTQFLWMRVPPQVWEKLGSGRLSGHTWNKHTPTGREEDTEYICVLIIKYVSIYPAAVSQSVTKERQRRGEQITLWYQIMN